MLQGQWIGIVWPADEIADRDPKTGVLRTVLENIGRASVTVPSGFVREFLPKWSVAQSINYVFLNIGNPPQTTAPCKEPAAEHREGCRLGLGHGRSKWLTLRFTNTAQLNDRRFFLGDGIRIVDARGMRCSDLGTGRWTRNIQPKVSYAARTGMCGILTLALLRHAMLVDQKTESVVVPLNTALAPQGKLELANSMWTLNWFNVILRLNRTHWRCLG